MTYFPLAHDLLTSSLWVEGTPTQIKVWLYLLLTADPQSGIVPDADPAIAMRCGLPMSEALAALDWLSRPDPFSRTPEHEGRRIQKLPDGGGYLILNYLKHRAQDHSTFRVRRFRERKRDETEGNGPPFHETVGNDETLHETEGNGGKRQTVPNRYRNEIEIEKEIQRPLAVKSVSTDISRSNPKQSLSTASTAPAVRAVFAYWQTALKKPGAKLDGKRRKAIAARLADGYTVEELQRAIDGCRRSLWHQGANERGRRYVDLELICRDAAHVDHFVEIATHGEGKPMSNTEIHNLRVLGLIGTDEPDAESPPLFPEPDPEKSRG